MTDQPGEHPTPAPDDSAGADDLAGTDDSAGGDGSAPAFRQPSRPVFSLEGRAAPGLYAAGWVLTVVGVAVALVALLSAPAGGTAPLALFVVGFIGLSLGLISAAAAQALQRHADSVPGYAGPSPFLVFLGAVALANLLYAPIYLAGSGTRLLPAAAPLSALVSLVISTLVYVGLIRLLVVGTASLDWRAMGLRRPDRAALRELLDGAALALPVYLVTIVLASLLATLLRTLPSSALPSPVDPAGWVVNLVSAMVVAPAGEELFFRGFATTAWWRTMGARSAIIRGAVFFALVHVIDVSGASFGEAAARAAIAFIARLPVGLFLGWLFIRRRSLYASFGLHATFNAIGVLLSLGT